MNERGYLLVEVLLASIILSVGIIALLSAMSKSLEVVRFSENHLTAVGVLERNLSPLDEELFGYEVVVPGYSLVGQGDYRVETTLLDGDGPLREMIITVTWQEGVRRPAISLASLVSEDFSPEQ